PKRRARMQKRSSFYPLTPNQKGVPAPDRSASYPGSFFDEKMLSLGATTRSVVKIISLEAGTMVAAGLALGMITSLAAAPWIRNLLYGVKPTDAGTLAAVVFAVVLVATAATVVPSFRAARVEPARALRQEA
ncbi:MAG: FtsX-like permease family protein, partial [Bryobacteraceae bacterium]